MDSVTWRKSHGTSVVYPQGFSLPFVAPQKPTQAGAGGNSPFRFSNGGRTGELRPRRAGGRREPAEKKGSGEKGFWASAAAVEAAPRRHANSRKPREVSGLCRRRRRLNPTRRGILDLPSAPRVQVMRLDRWGSWDMGTAEGSGRSGACEGVAVLESPIPTAWTRGHRWASVSPNGKWEEESGHPSPRARLSL